MSKKFYAINKETGERFVSNKHHYLIMYDSGYCGVVETQDGYYTSVSPLDTRVWRVMYKANFVKQIHKGEK